MEAMLSRCEHSRLHPCSVTAGDEPPGGHLHHGVWQMLQSRDFPLESALLSVHQHTTVTACSELATRLAIVIVTDEQTTEIK